MHSGPRGSFLRRWITFRHRAGDTASDPFLVVAGGPARAWLIGSFLLPLQDRQGLFRVSRFPRMEEPHNGAETGSEARDEILRKVGRNVLLFQQAERRLKWLAARKRIAGMPDEIAIAAGKLGEQVARETLGAVMRRAIDTAAPGEQEQARIEAAVMERGCTHLEFGFEISFSDSETNAAWREGLEALVEDRNELVHHFLDRFDIWTIEGCQQADQYLAEQHARHAPLVEDLRRHCEEISAGMGMLSEALKQDDVLAEILHGHLRLELEVVLRQVAAEKARADGWTDLCHAGNQLAGKDPQLLKRLEEAFGHRGLKQAVAAIGGWQLIEEVTNGGGKRVLYRSADSQPTIE